MEATGEEPSYSIINLINHFIVYRERWELVEGNALKGPSWIVILPISASSLQKKKRKWRKNSTIKPASLLCSRGFSRQEY